MHTQGDKLGYTEAFGTRPLNTYTHTHTHTHTHIHTHMHTHRATNWDIPRHLASGP